MQVLGRSLLDRVDRFPDPWIHESGDKLVGQVVELATAENEYGPYPVVTVTVTGPESTERGGESIAAGAERVWHAFGVVPRNELKKQTPTVGDLIAVKYFGVGNGNNNTTYKKYRIIVEPKVSFVNAAVTDSAGAVGDERRSDAIDAEPDTDEESFADLFRMAGASTAQVGPGGHIPYR